MMFFLFFRKLLFCSGMLILGLCLVNSYTQHHVLFRGLDHLHTSCLGKLWAAGTNSKVLGQTGSQQSRVKIFYLSTRKC